ncbi:hypothetical protein FKM82_027872 [Ascaphus truei]
MPCLCALHVRSCLSYYCGNGFGALSDGLCQVYHRDSRGRHSAHPGFVCSSAVFSHLWLVHCGGNRYLSLTGTPDTCASVLWGAVTPSSLEQQDCYPATHGNCLM